MQPETLNSLELALKLAAYVTGAVSLIVTAYSVRKNSLVNGAKFWLELRRMFADFDDLSRSLQLDATWRNENRSVTDAEKLSIISYMGLFEHCYVMMEDGLIDKNIFRHIFSYRITIIMDSPAIVESTLVKSSRYWENFRKLVKELKFSLPEAGDREMSAGKLKYPIGWADD